MRGRAARALRFDGPPARGRRGVLAPRFAPRLALSAPRDHETISSPAVHYSNSRFTPRRDNSVILKNSFFIRNDVQC